MTASETLAEWAKAQRADDLPRDVRDRCEDLLLDVAGLCLAARRRDYVRSVIGGVDAGGDCTAIGHEAGFRAEDAAMINGTAAHGEDFDDTFEGGPVHSGAVIVPAVLAACEHFGRRGADALLGIATGAEALCRMSLVAPKRIHNAGFHPTAVLGTMAAALGVSKALGLSVKQTVDALGIAGSMAGGIIEYLAEGAWTKRLHAGWAAQSGLRAARLGRGTFSGPRTVLDGAHGLYAGFARTADADVSPLIENLGRDWRMASIAFKPYATGTMNQPYIDCALRLAKKGFAAEDVVQVQCETAEGYVHRLWEPLQAKRRPANGYAAKFSTPFNIAVAFVSGGAGFDAFTDERACDPRVLALAGKVGYTVDPKNPYPASYTGHVRMTLKDGRVLEERQPHLRGGAREPLPREDLERKFLGNAAFGGLRDAQARAWLRRLRKIFSGNLDLAAGAGLRHDDR